MESAEYEQLRNMSSALFNNGLLLPVALVIARTVAVEGTFTARSLRERLQGRAESNQLRDIVDRIARIDAVAQLPHPGRPHPRVWTRRSHSFWGFVEMWAGEVVGDSRVTASHDA